MIAARLIEFIETHADGLTRDVLKDLATNARTPSFQRVPSNELEARVFATYHNLGKWITGSSDDAIRVDYETWGAKRFRQGIPLSEIVYALIVVKHHLRRFVQDHGLVEFSGDPVGGDMIGVQLYAIQDLNYRVGDFFDRATYYLARGYEAEAAASAGAPPPGRRAGR